MENRQRVFIHGVEGRGNEVIAALVNLGGKNDVLKGGNNPGSIYFIKHDGYIGFIGVGSETAKIIMDYYREIKLPEQWKDGDILFSETDDEFAVFKEWKTESDKFLAYFATCHGGYLTLQVIRRRDFRLTTKLEVEQFYEYLHSIGKDWDAEKKQLVDWKWKPKKGERYWLIRSDGHVGSGVFGNDEYDNNAYNFGNCFKTREEAKAMAEKIKNLLKDNL